MENPLLFFLLWNLPAMKICCIWRKHIRKGFAEIFVAIVVAGNLLRPSLAQDVVLGPRTQLWRNGTCRCLPRAELAVDPSDSWAIITYPVNNVFEMLKLSLSDPATSSVITTSSQYLGIPSWSKSGQITAVSEEADEHSYGIGLIVNFTNWNPDADNRPLTLDPILIAHQSVYSEDLMAIGYSSVMDQLCILKKEGTKFFVEGHTFSYVWSKSGSDLTFLKRYKSGDSMYLAVCNADIDLGITEVTKILASQVSGHELYYSAIDAEAKNVYSVLPENETLMSIWKQPMSSDIPIRICEFPGGVESFGVGSKMLVAATKQGNLLKIMWASEAEPSKIRDAVLVNYDNPSTGRDWKK